MIDWGKCFRSAAIGLTAITTLIAATPHFDCRCPDGRIKPFCLSVLFGASQCCCEGACCPVPPDDSARGPLPRPALVAKSCCCGRQAEPREDRTGAVPGSQFSTTGCTKVLVEARVTSLDKGPQAPERDLTPAPFTTPAQPLRTLSEGPALACRAAGDSRRPPPTDLVTLLEHFLI
jgi:hypothetical protein